MSSPLSQQFWNKLTRLIGQRRARQWQAILRRYGALPAVTRCIQPKHRSTKHRGPKVPSRGRRAQ